MHLYYSKSWVLQRIFYSIVIRLHIVYSSITIIFNPNSTGDAPQNARELAKELKRSFKKIPLNLLETERVGHAEELAYKAAKNGEEPLIIAASGDGGYNEVVNGAMQATKEGATPICAVLASGNANDHRRMVRKRPLQESIVAHDISRLDLLEVHWGDEHRYAHSYVGFGLTPAVAVELNRHNLSSLKELVFVVKTFWKYQPFEIMQNNKKLKLDNLVLANISGMAKVLKLSEDSKPTDGKFEVMMAPHKHKMSALVWALKSATVGLGNQPQTNKFIFTTIKPTPMQLDGEVVKLAANTKVRVAIDHKKLRTVR